MRRRVALESCWCENGRPTLIFYSSVTEYNQVLKQWVQSEVLLIYVIRLQTKEISGRCSVHDRHIKPNVTGFRAIFSLTAATRITRL